MVIASQVRIAIFSLFLSRSLFPVSTCHWLAGRWCYRLHFLLLTSISQLQFLSLTGTLDLGTTVILPINIQLQECMPQCCMEKRDTWWEHETDQVSSKLENTRLPSDEITGASSVGLPHAMESSGLSPGSRLNLWQGTPDGRQAF